MMMLIIKMIKTKLVMNDGADEMLRNNYDADDILSNNNDANHLPNDADDILRNSYDANGML